MKKVLVILAIAFAAVQSYAVVGLGLRDAIIIGSYTGDDLKDYSGTGDVFTFDVNIPVTDLISIHPGLGFSYATLINTKGNFDTEIDYIDLSLPVMVRFNIVKGFFAEIGPAFDLNLLTTFDNGFDTDDLDDANSMNIGLAIGAGYVFGFGFGIDGRLNYGLNDSFDPEYGSCDAARFGFQIGLSYWFKGP